MVCQQCGQEASSEHAFCSACGAPLAGSVPPAYTGQPDQGNAAPAADRPSKGHTPTTRSSITKGPPAPLRGSSTDGAPAPTQVSPTRVPAPTALPERPLSPQPRVAYQSGPYPPNPGSPLRGLGAFRAGVSGWPPRPVPALRGPPRPPGQYPPYPGGSGQYPPPPPGMPYGQPWRQMNRTGTNRYSNIGIVLGIISFILLPIILGPAGLIVSGRRPRGQTGPISASSSRALGLVCGIILSLLAHHAVYG